MTRVTILGSSVTREAFRFDEKKNIKIDKYYSRTSLISQYGGKIAHDKNDVVLSRDFYLRTLFEDLECQFMQDIPNISSDYIILDFIDDRSNLLLIEENYALYSRAMQESGLFPKLNPRIIKRDTESDLELMADAITRFSIDVHKNNLQDKIVLHECYLANEFIPAIGNKVNSFSEKEKELITTFNQRLFKYYQLMKNAFPNLKIITPKGIALKWGKEPFHFEDAYYTDFLKQLDAIITTPTLINNESSLIELQSNQFIYGFSRHEYISNILRSTKQYYEIATLERWKKYYIYCKYVLDIGANIGNHSLYWLRSLDIEKIISFEPMYETFEILKKIIN